jgi:hypothetical protein
MSYDLPTAAEFKARHTGFAAVLDATVTAFLTEASASVSTCWAEADYQPAIMYLAAHLIAEETSAGGTSAASKAGPIKRVKADTVEIEYMSGNVSDASLGLTIYGRRFLALRHRNAPRALVV